MFTYTESELQAWKEKWGKDSLFLAKVEATDSTPENPQYKSCVLHKPTRKGLSYASSVGTKDPIKFNEIILEHCWIAGDEEIKTNDSLFLAVCPTLEKLVEVKQGEIVKL